MDSPTPSRILYNAIKTPDGTILHSKHVHDFVIHEDKNGKKYGIDGGNEYRKFTGDWKDCEDLLVMDDGTFETRREYIHWGRNFDEKGNRLEATEYIPVKYLSTPHIEAIIRNGFCRNAFILELLTEELSTRDVHFI